MIKKFLPEELIEEVRARNDIVDVVSEYLPLKRSGSGFFALCPFHNEKTPSFHVCPQRQIYHCFGCGVGGNVFTFIMAMEHLNFVEAVKFLAERAGMSIPDTVDSDEFVKLKEKKEKLYKLNQEAARYYHKQLLSDKGKEALRYLESRGLDLKTIKSFGLGYAPDGWENVKNYLLDLGFEEDLLVESGIVVKNKSSIYDRFRNRIIFPIIHPRGMVIGFGGRVMDDSLPKYLNSPESPVFRKSSTLFGLNLAKKHRPLESILIVEGYMDAITLHQFGFKNAVASLGTSLTLQQARIIRRYSENVYIAYDGDAAGQKATLRGLDILQEAGCKVRVLRFPEGMDPDEVLREYGAEYFKQLVAKSLPLVDFKLDQLRKDYDLNSRDGKVAYATAAAKILAKIPNLLERDMYVQRLEALTGFKASLLYRQIEDLEEKSGGRIRKNIIGNNRHTKDVEVQSSLVPSNIKAERCLVSLMVRNESFARKVVKKLDRSMLEEGVSIRVFDTVVQLLSSGKHINAAEILNYADDQEMVQQMVEIFETEVEYDNIDKFIDDCIDKINYYHLKKCREQLRQEIIRLERSGSVDPERYRKLLQQMNEMNQKVKMFERRKEGIM